MERIPEDAGAPLRSHLERELLPVWLPQRRWWRSKSRALRSVSLEAAIPIGDSLFTLARAEFAGGASERYAVPLRLLAAEHAGGFPEDAVLGSSPDGKRIVDACRDAGFRAALLEVLSGRRECGGYGGTLRGRPVDGGFSADPSEGSRLYAGEQSNTSFSFGDRVAVKIYRRVEPGIHPEPEMLRFLRERTGFRAVPAFLSALEWHPGNGSGPVMLALAQEFVSGATDAWGHAVGALAAALKSPDAGVPGAFLAWAALLGRRVGEMHAALGSRPDDPDFAPEPLAPEELDETRTAILGRLDEALAGLAFAQRARLEAMLRDDSLLHPGGARIRTHGDLHLGQILVAGEDVRILDFEGEPGRALSEARRKRTPLRDAAGMLRSFHYAAHVAAREAGAAPDRADTLSDAAGAAFLKSYRAPLEGSGLLPAGDADAAVLRLHVLEKAVYELEYERNNRPDWVEIPLRGLITLCKAASGG